MLWNFMIHALMGWLGPYFFILTPGGIGMAIVVTCITQAVDQIRIKKEKTIEIEQLPEKDRAAATTELEANLRTILLKTFIQNTAIFTLVILAAAHLGRSYGWL